MIYKIFTVFMLLLLFSCTEAKIKNFEKTKKSIDELRLAQNIECHKDDIEVLQKLYEDSERYLKEDKQKKAEEANFAAEKLLQKIKSKKCPEIVKEEKTENIESVEVESNEIKTENISSTDVVKDDKINFTPIYFEFNSFTITDEGKKVLLDNLSKFEQKKIKEIIIDGHTDIRGSEEYNLSLSQKRASVVKQFLIEQGIKKDIIKTIGYGEENIVEPGNDEMSHAKNRRAEFNIIE